MERVQISASSEAEDELLNLLREGQQKVPGLKAALSICYGDGYSSGGRSVYYTGEHVALGWYRQEPFGTAKSCDAEIRGMPVALVGEDLIRQLEQGRLVMRTVRYDGSEESVRLFMVELPEAGEA